MPDDPYAPPIPLSRHSSSRGEIYRPVSVLFLIFFLVALVLIYSWGLSKYLRAAAAHWEEIRGSWSFAISLSWRVGVVALCIATAYGVYRGSNLSRWIGIMAIIAVGALVLSGYRAGDYTEDSGPEIGAFLHLCFFGLLVWWVYVLALSSGVRRYFSSRDEA